MITYNQIMAKISESVKLSGKMQAELAKDLGVTQQTISDYLHCKKMPSVETLANLCAVLDLDANEILCLK